MARTLFYSFVPLIMLTTSQQCASVATHKYGFYDPLFEGFDLEKMHNEMQIQYHSVADFYKFNEIANIAASANTLLYRVYLSEAARTMGAVCIDGSDPVIYFRPGSGDGVNKFQISFQGGGWCAGLGNMTYQLVPSMDNCYHRSQMYLGSTVADAPYVSFNGYGSDSQTENPLSYNWNTVFVRYCSGGSFMSDLQDPILYNGNKLYFRGFRILNAALTYLTTEYQLDQATDVLVTGGSAGGLTVWQHANYIRDTFVSPTANFMAMPDCGFFAEWEGIGGYITGWQWHFDHVNVTSSLNACQPECVDYYTKNGGDIMQCVFAQNIAPFVRVKMFALQSRFDAWQLTHELCEANNDTASNEYGDSLTQKFLDNFIASNTSLHFAYFDSCYHHCGKWNTITIDGYNQSMAEFEIYYSNLTHSNLFFQNDSYPCSACCS